jgi:hypothetical protein
MAALLALLRRFAVEAAREEARSFCDDLVAEMTPANDMTMPEGAIGAVPMRPEIRLVA